MDIRIYQPRKALAGYIRNYSIMESNVPGIRERVLPAENIQLMFHFRKPFVFCHANGTEIPQPVSIITGLANQSLNAKTVGHSGVIFVSFHPLGACHFFRFPLIEIKNCNIDLSAVDKKEMNDTEDLLKEKNNDHDRITVIENFLLRRLYPIPYYDYSLLLAAVDGIKTNHGLLSANRLANQLCTTQRTLERKFTNYIGTSPKQYASLIRFQNIIRDISSETSLTRCCYRYGYFDQAHFIKDFSAFSGLTPGEYLRLRAEHINMNTDSMHA